MITTGDHIEISGIITATTTGAFTASLNEIYMDGQWRKFSPSKSLEVTETDYDKTLTPQELELIKLLADKNKDVSTFTPDQQTLAKSIVAKLTEEV